MRQKILPRDAESRRKKAGKGVSRRRDYVMFHMEHFPTKTENPLGRRRKSRREGHNYISRETLRGDPPGCSPPGDDPGMTGYYTIYEPPGGCGFN